MPRLCVSMSENFEHKKYQKSKEGREGRRRKMYDDDHRT